MLSESSLIHTQEKDNWQVIIECTLPSWDFSNKSDKGHVSSVQAVSALTAVCDPSRTLSPRVHGHFQKTNESPCGAAVYS